MSKVSVILPYFNRLKLLSLTLESFELLYKNNDIEIVIVNDHSDDIDEVKIMADKHKLNIKIVDIKNKNGINPCYPYNVGVRESSGDIIVLSSPEIFHTISIWDISDNFKELNDNTYLQFSVFCITDRNFYKDFFAQDISSTILSVRSKSYLFFEHLGEYGYSFNNRYGSWYTHSNIRPSCLNFLSALTRNKYYDLSGFDERFRFGTGYDDEEFKIRILDSGSKVYWYDDVLAIHMDHEIVNNSQPTTNNSIFYLSQIDRYSKNDNWGIL